MNHVAPQPDPPVVGQPVEGRDQPGQRGVAGRSGRRLGCGRDPGRAGQELDDGQDHQQGQGEAEDDLAGGAAPEDQGQGGHPGAAATTARRWSAATYTPIASRTRARTGSHTPRVPTTISRLATTVRQRPAPAGAPADARAAPAGALARRRATSARSRSSSARSASLSPGSCSIRYRPGRPPPPALSRPGGGPVSRHGPAWPPAGERSSPAEGEAPPRVRVPAEAGGQGAGVSRWVSCGTAVVVSMSLTWVVP
jgi:hypothetical protein